MSVFGQVGRIDNFFVKNNLVQIVVRFSIDVRILARHHFVHKNAKGPPIDAEAVMKLISIEIFCCLLKILFSTFLILQYLRRHVLRGAAESRCQFAILHSVFAQAEIGNFHMPVAVKKNIFGFKIS
jgi:hypothetical protein